MSLESLTVLTQLAGLSTPTSETVQIDGIDPLFPMRYRVVAPGAAAIAATGLAASELWALRTGRKQKVRVGACAAQDT